MPHPGHATVGHRKDRWPPEQVGADLRISGGALLHKCRLSQYLLQNSAFVAKRLESGQRYLDGFTLHYNLFRQHESLGGMTPGSTGAEELFLDQPFQQPDGLRCQRDIGCHSDLAVQRGSQFGCVPWDVWSTIFKAYGGDTFDWAKRLVPSVPDRLAQGTVVWRIMGDDGFGSIHYKALVIGADIPRRL